MAMVHISNKPLTVNPLKVSQPMGATLAVLGLDQAVPLQHGAQGCTAFSKVFFTRHFREPVALQTTAMDQVVTVMGADRSVVEALRTVAELNNPEVIGLMTTGLTETQGADIARTVKEFQRSSPEFMDISVIPINTPDTLGSLESGYARALEAVIEHLVPEGRVAGYRPRQVNVLLSSMLTPGDAEAVRAWVEAFGLRPVMLPDLGGSLDGHFNPEGFSTLSRGGVSRIDVATMGKSVATLAVGPSVFTAAERLKARTGVPDHRFDGLMGLAECDAFTEALAGISGRSVPDRIDRLREQLLDAMVDTHFVLGALRLGVAADPDHLGMLARFLTGVGIHVVAAVASSRAEGLVDLPIEAVIVGDLEDLEAQAKAGRAQVLIANSHGADIAERLRIPLLRAGFPLYDIFGGAARKWVGYDGSRQALFDLANLASAARPEIAPYRSFYGKERPPEMDGHVPVAASGASTLPG